MSEQILLRMPTASSIWKEVRDGDPLALEMFKRHYSFYRYSDNRRDDLNNKARWLFVGPGQKMVLVSSDALFVWRKFKDDSGQQGVNCAVFRNESDRIASELILEAEKCARTRWPNDRLYTYVNPKRIQRTRQPGRCFIKAGWKKCGTTKGGLVILEKL